jgi:hypothetical protein
MFYKKNYGQNKCLVSRKRKKHNSKKQKDLTNKEFGNYEQKLDNFNAWTKQDASYAWDELKIQKAQLVLTRLKGGALFTSSYIIQWNLLKDHQSFENFYQLNKPFKNLCRPWILNFLTTIILELETSINLFSITNSISSRSF